MSRRLIAVAMCLVILVTCMAAPASAAESTSNISSLINLLDYGYSQENGTNSIGFGGGDTVQLTYGMNSRIAVSYVDVLFSYTSSGSVDVSLMNGSSVKSTLKVENIDANIYRAYGSFNAYYANSFGLLFEASKSNSNRITIHRFEIGRFPNTRTFISPYAYVLDGSGRFHEFFYTPPGAGEMLNSVDWTGGSDYRGEFFTAGITFPDWRKYDYVDVLVNFAVDDIISITGMFDEMILPTQVSYLSNSNNELSMYAISIRLDLRNIERSVVDSDPYITIYGNEFLGGDNYFTVVYACGSVEYEAESPFVYWMQNLKLSLGELGSNIVSVLGEVIDTIYVWGQEITIS